MRVMFFLLAAVLLWPDEGLALPQSNATRPMFIPAPQQPVKEVEPGPWAEMPAGARKAYIGIHGGTVPVSLLAAGDGTPMIAQVGLTGSDFLNFIRSRGKSEAWSAADFMDGAETMAGHVVQPPLTGQNATLLLTGTSVGDVPVIYATGQSFEKMAIVPSNWAPFGLTKTPLSLEGALKLPPKELKPTRSRSKR